jgi:TetR/AcrR family transcriptional regulator, mexJK operon transcriptional repressor
VLNRREGPTQNRAPLQYSTVKYRRAYDGCVDEATTRPAAPAAPRRRAGRLASGGVIREAATALFLRNGYLGTSIDEIAAQAGVSKQTVYTHFADKEQLFTELVRGNSTVAEEFIQALAGLPETDDLERDLGHLARRYVAAVIQPRVLQLRRLVIGESGRFPELARSYHEHVPERVISTLADCLRRLGDRGLLRVDDPALAASHLAWLILAVPLDRAMFCGDGTFPPAELDRFADAGVRVFLAAYGRS